MDTISTPLRWQVARFSSLKNPRSELYSCGALPNVAWWRLNDASTWSASLGFPVSTSYCVISPCALSARNTLWPNFTGVSTFQIRMRFENGVDLLGVGNRLSQQHAATCLIDDALSETTI